MRDIFVVNTVRDGEVINTWASGDVMQVIQHAERCVEEYAKKEALKDGLSMPSHIVVTRVGDDFNEIVWGWLPEDLED